VFAERWRAEDVLYQSHAARAGARGHRRDSGERAALLQNWQKVAAQGGNQAVGVSRIPFANRSTWAHTLAADAAGSHHKALITRTLAERHHEVTDLGVRRSRSSAEVALRRGRPADALKLLEPVRGEAPPELLAGAFYSEETSRYLRAELLHQLGRDEEALRWLRNGFQETPLELVLLAPAHFRQAELYERLGDRKQAADHYSRFIQLWKRCDPELRPSIEQAKVRLASLMSEPRDGSHPR
jgi:tetratricopeptide (TPR) repeat protein